MGPRLISRGNPTVVIVIALPVVLLQWGRD
jgi:hypothetical protein